MKKLYILAAIALIAIIVVSAYVQMHPIDSMVVGDAISAK